MCIFHEDIFDTCIYIHMKMTEWLDFVCTQYPIADNSNLIFEF